MKLKSLFKTTIATGKLGNKTSLFNKKLKNEILQLSKQDKAGRAWSLEHYKGGYTSYNSLCDLHRRAPVFADFADKLHPKVEQFAKAQGWSIKKGQSLVLTSLWMNIMPRHTYHPLHFHPYSVVSGAYYVSVPPNSVALKLEDPRMSYFMHAPLRKLKASKESPLYVHIKPEEGSWVLFESWLRHEVPPNESIAPRISLSFNYDIDNLDAY